MKAPSLKAPVATAVPFNADILRADCSNLSNLLAVAVRQMQELDFGSGATRNRELDQVNALIEIASESAERLVSNVEASLDIPTVDRVPARVVISEKPSDVAVHRDAPRLKFDGWSILDYEVVFDCFDHINHAAQGIINQPRCCDIDRPSRFPGRTFVQDFLEDWLDFNMSDLIDRLKAIRFEDREDDERRMKLIMRFYLAYSDDNDLKAFASFALHKGRLT